MIAGLGIDLVEVQRVEKAVSKYGDRFLQRIFTRGEQNVYRQGVGVERLAARFAAKEAVLKALGTGLAAGVTWLDVEVTSQGGRPSVALHGAAREIALKLKVQSIHISLTHERGMAAAVVVLEADDRSEVPVL